MYRTGQQEYIMASQPKKLEDLFHDTPKDIYFAEKKICGFNFPAHRNLRVSEGVENLLR